MPCTARCTSRRIAGRVSASVACRTDAAVKQFLAFRLGEVTASGEGLASELSATKVRREQNMQ